MSLGPPRVRVLRRQLGGCLRAKYASGERRTFSTTCSRRKDRAGLASSDAGGLVDISSAETLLGNGLARTTAGVARRPDNAFENLSNFACYYSIAIRRTIWA